MTHPLISFVFRTVSFPLRARPFEGRIHPRRFVTMSSSKASASSLRTALTAVRDSLPAQDGSSHKGQAGRICIVGGSADFTGSPYFAAMTTMRAGADLAFVVTEASAATALKASCPDLIVYPSFDPLFSDPSPVLSRAHALVVGPGIGRESEAAKAVHAALLHSDAADIPVVVDADALFFLAKDADLRKEVAAMKRKAPLVLTPNAPELKRLCDAVDASDTRDLINVFGPTTVILAKGAADDVVTQAARTSVDVSGALKRVGGQGDILTGLLAVCLNWHCEKFDKHVNSDKDSNDEHALQALQAVAAGAALTREASRRAFVEYKRSLLASDILSYIGPTIYDLESGSLIDDITQ